jgi:hypothetical protein
MMLAVLCGFDSHNFREETYSAGQFGGVSALAGVRGVAQGDGIFIVSQGGQRVSSACQFNRDRP